MMGEVWISIPGLRFSYTQAPQSMKSVLTAAWFANNAFGNLIVVVLTEIQPTTIQSIEFFLYAGLMFVGTIIFTLLARNYEKNNMITSEDEVIEAFIYSKAVQSSNLEENLDDDCESIKSLERY
jgi:dipeptide/tripeptide permease